MPKIDVNKVAEILKKNEISPAVLRRVMEELNLAVQPDPGEEESAAALREMKEEIGTDKAEILGESRDWFAYDLPPELGRTAWKGRYRGQKQKWFAMRFTGQDADIDLGAHEPEFSAFQWVDLDKLPDLIVPFKRDTYRRVIAALGRYA